MPGLPPCWYGYSVDTALWCTGSGEGLVCYSAGCHTDIVQTGSDTVKDLLPVEWKVTGCSLLLNTEHNTEMLMLDLKEIQQ